MTQNIKEKKARSRRRKRKREKKRKKLSYLIYKRVSWLDLHII
jgi:hypothetical protein